MSTRRTINQPATVICASTCAKAPARLMPIMLNCAEACFLSVIITAVAAQPPASDNQKPGFKNEPMKKLPSKTRNNVTAHALAAPNKYSANNVAIFARPGFAHGNGRGKIASKRNITNPKPAKSAVRASRCAGKIDLVSNGVIVRSHCARSR